MIDIIIPAYNAHKTIKRTIKSIKDQNYKDYKITIINDGGEPYNIKGVIELTTENKGPGHARNYGIKHTNGEYILFVDADDFLLPCALSNLMSQMEENVGLVIGTIIAEEENGTTRLIKSNSNFMHGKLYNRKYLQEFNIWSNEESICCEDDSFNSQCLICLHGTKYTNPIIEVPVYEWTYTKDSLGRRDPITWEHQIVPIEITNNKIYVFNELKKKGLDNGRIRVEKARTMLQCIIGYIRDKIQYPQFEQSNWNNVIRCYNEIYAEIEPIVHADVLKRILQETVLPKATDNDFEHIMQYLTQLKIINLQMTGVN